jgi:ribonucleoside-diphosphate reductase alpha chain
MVAATMSTLEHTGDERRRTHDMNSADWVPDLFMERVEADETALKPSNRHKA